MHFIHHLCNHAQIERGAFDTVPKNGYQNLVDTLREELRASELERLGIVVDGDVDVIGRWESLRNKLRDVGYDSVPTHLQAGGQILLAPDKPVVGIWVMPDNTAPGILEDFVSKLVPPGDPLWTYAQGCVDKIPEEHRKFRPGARSKAYIHTWLAWQEEPGTPLGQAITKRYLDATTSSASEFVTWLKKLFDYGRAGD
jgi:hypothetical protein